MLFSSSRRPTHHVPPISRIAEILKSGDEFFLPLPEPVGCYKHLLRENYGVYARSEKVKGGALLVKYEPEPKKPKQKGGLIQAFVPEWSNRCSGRDSLLILLRRGPVYIPGHKQRYLDELRQNHPGLKLSEHQYAKGVIVTLEQ